MALWVLGLSLAMLCAMALFVFTYVPVAARARGPGRRRAGSLLRQLVQLVREEARVAGECGNTTSASAVRDWYNRRSLDDRHRRSRPSTLLSMENELQGLDKEGDRAAQGAAGVEDAA